MISFHYLEFWLLGFGPSTTDGGCVPKRSFSAAIINPLHLYFIIRNLFRSIGIKAFLIILLTATVVMHVLLFNLMTENAVKISHCKKDIDNDVLEVQKVFLTKYPDPKRYAIYYCKADCGGLGDRQKGIVGAYLLSILTNRTFGIIHNSPVPLTAFVHPNKINWTIPESELKGFTFQTFDDDSLLGKLSKLNLNALCTEDIVYFTIGSSEFVNQIRRHYSVPKILPIIMRLSNSVIYRSVLQLLFKLSPDLQEQLERIYSNIKKKALVCSHLRMGKNEALPWDTKPVMSVNQTQKIWKFLDRYKNSDKYSIFIATDSNEIRALAIKRFPTQYLDVPGKIIHIDQIGYRNETEGIEKIFLEQSLLSRCDVLLLTRRSGFSMIASYLRSSSSNLYCFYNGEIVRCSVDLIDEIYPFGSGFGLSYSFKIIV